MQRRGPHVDFMVMARSTLRKDAAWPARMTSFTTLEVNVPMDVTPASYDLHVFTIIPVTVEGCDGPADCEWAHVGDWPIHHAADPTWTPDREAPAVPVMGSCLVDVTAP